MDLVLTQDIKQDYECWHATNQYIDVHDSVLFALHKFHRKIDPLDLFFLFVCVVISPVECT
jgi:hypothetical protein